MAKVVARLWPSPTLVLVVCHSRFESVQYGFRVKEQNSCGGSNDQSTLSGA